MTDWREGSSFEDMHTDAPNHRLITGDAHVTNSHLTCIDTLPALTHVKWRVNTLPLLMLPRTHARTLTTTQSNHVDTLIITYTHAKSIKCINFTYKMMVIKMYQVQSYKIKKIYYISRITHATIKSRKKIFISKTYFIYPIL